MPVTVDEAGRRAAPAGQGSGPAANQARRSFPDWRFAPNIGNNPGTYEIENRALDRTGHVINAMHRLAPWAGRTVVDLGCGTGFWLPRYAAEAGRVIGIEPDPALRAQAAARTAGMPGIEVRAGSAEHLGLPRASVDVVHARFAYFFPPDGTRKKADATDAWWRDRGAIRREVHSGWTFERRADLEAVLRIEFPAHVADAWLARHPAATSISYGYVLFAVAA